MKSKILDAVGISAAVLCLIHCIIFPLLLIIPLGISHNPYIDLAFLIIGAAVVYRVTKHMTNIWLKFIFCLSILLISISVFVDLLFEIHIPLIYVGAAGLIIAHIINFKNHKH
ncbi:MerC domain-containing protein [Chryseobacterium indologenes]|uniref:MerC domain-containing protein n=1 Tax=Chryseobacterium indologenes TaxID=253 RepID=A0A1Z3W0G8_CHRID|nr:MULTISPECIES: MerC domain-containing protein [Chryseobacterium]ASE61243.1 MerC domain-containing protein [Chryseobacterium indologenes]ATN05327.1 MerC domain-containing protein [Chryseobacterium indologenes]AYY85914.1 MerC domain-containing protein [Chryseobacterium indologenes]AYZ35685.1 MerC domain-containing protein [Chryseobacterium indologenes]AZB16915.1 MerC domain-containing protein [Chryseobacterium indologenes]